MQAISTPEQRISSPQAWLASPAWDISLIILPAFLSSIIALSVNGQIGGSQTLPLWAWVCLILMVDVAHVYASLFRTYFHREAVEKNRTLLLSVPLICWVVGCLSYSIDGILFWRVLAYLAVFHFIRQQYGFMSMYSRKEPNGFKTFRLLDQVAIYAATLYPLLYWHTNLPRNFVWFVPGDFIEFLPSAIAQGALAAYAVTAACYVIKELSLFYKTGYFNIPKNLLLAGTALSWWTGIISLNSDLAFTMTNVLSHGIPYMALIWLYHHTKKVAQAEPAQERSNQKIRTSSATRFVLASIPAFLIFLWIAAYFEEGLWAGLVWREHISIFPLFMHLPHISDPSLLAVLIPFLSLPQSTHYVLDGFIWKVKDKSSIWST